MENAIVPESQDGKEPCDYDSALKAFDAGLAVVPIPYALMSLDIDYGVNNDALNRQGISDYDVLTIPSKSGKPGHKHVLIDIRRFEHIFSMPMSQRSFLATSFGSDPIREFLSVERAAVGYPYPYKLFIQPEKYGVAAAWAVRRGLSLPFVTKAEYLDAVEAHKAQTEDLDDLPF
jgi:hypothetical protein